MARRQYAELKIHAKCRIDPARLQSNDSEYDTTNDSCARHSVSCQVFLSTARDTASARPVLDVQDISPTALVARKAIEGVDGPAGIGVMVKTKLSALADTPPLANERTSAEELGLYSQSVVPAHSPVDIDPHQACIRWKHVKLDFPHRCLLLVSLGETDIIQISD